MTHTRIDKHEIRKVNALMKDIEVIEMDCMGTKSNRYADSKLDPFQRNKQELTEVLSILKQDIKTKNGIEERVGTNAESIKLKSKIKKNLEAARKLQVEMSDAYKTNERDVDNGENDMELKEIKNRQELVSLLQQDLEFTQNEFEPQKSRTNATGFRLAQMGREKRKKLREKGLISEEAQPLTAKQQTFIQESYARDAILDNKLDMIRNGVITLGAIAADINIELDKQEVMLEELEVKMDNVQDKIEHRNEEIKKLLDSAGGATRWCPVLILCIILMACLGYIYNAFVVE
eukprot:708959_1